MSEPKYDAFVIVYAGRNTAEKAYRTLSDLQDLDRLSIDSAAVIYRQDDGRLKVEMKRRGGLAKGLTGGGVIGLLLAAALGGPIFGATAAGAAVGALVTSSRAQERSLKETLETKLGQHDSALAVLIKGANWPYVLSRVGQYNGEVVGLELKPETRAQLEKLIAEREGADAVARYLDVSEAEA
jgi:uncharacterized membrane protein